MEWEEVEVEEAEGVEEEEVQEEEQEELAHLGEKLLGALAEHRVQPQHARRLDRRRQLGWLAMGATFVHQQRLIKSRDRDRCFQAFLNNHWSGLLLFAGLGLSLYPSLG